MKLRGWLLTACCLGLSAQQGERLSLDEALRLAVQNNLDVQLEKLKVDSRSIALDLTRAGYEPVLESSLGSESYDYKPTNVFEGDPDNTFTNKRKNLNMTLRKSEDFGLGYSVAWNNSSSDSSSRTSFGQSYSSSLTLGFEQKLLSGFAFDPAIPRKDEYIARGYLGISRLDLEFRMIQVLAEAENAYWDLVQAHDDLKVRQNSLRLAQQLHEQNRIKIEVGTLAPIELVSAEATVASREADVVGAENRAKAAEDRLKRILNLPREQWSRSIVPKDEPGTPAPDVALQEALQRAESQRVELKSSALLTENALLDLRYRRNQTLPSLNLEGGYTLRGTSNPLLSQGGEVVEDSSFSDALSQVTSRDLPGFSVSLNFRWTPLNRAAKLQLAQSELDLRNRELEEQKIRTSIFEEVRGALRELDSTAKSIAANEKARHFREENLKAEIQKFQNGLSTNFNVAQAQDELAQANSAEIAARIAHRKAQVAYLQAIGSLIQERRIILP